MRLASCFRCKAVDAAGYVADWDYQRRVAVTTIGGRRCEHVRLIQAKPHLKGGSPVIAVFSLENTEVKVVVRSMFWSLVDASSGSSSTPPVFRCLKAR